MNECWRRVSIAGAMLVSLSSMAFSQEGTPPQMATVFRVVIKDSQQQPKPDVRVTLGKPNAYTLQAIMRGNTSADGILTFSKVVPGRYTLQMIDQIGETNLVDVQVLAKGGEKEFSFAWPYVHWLTMPSVTGTLMSGPSPLNHRNVIVRGFPDGREIGSAATDLQGRFDVPVSQPGRYTLDISQINANGVSENLGRIHALVTLDMRNASIEPLFLEFSPRGVEFDHICKREAAEPADSCFEVTDREGKVLPGAVFTLKAQSGYATLQKYITDAQGHVKLPDFPAGVYDAQVFGKGLTPAKIQIKLNGSAGKCAAPLKIPLNVIGSGCAPAIP